VAAFAVAAPLFGVPLLTMTGVVTSSILLVLSASLALCGVISRVCWAVREKERAILGGDTWMAGK
jgi:hypothetical protein